MSKLLEKYNELKKENASCIYVFRVGIFYNILNEDAKILNKKIGLKITSLSPEIIKCGFPISSLDKYIAKFKELQLEYKILDNPFNYTEKEVSEEIIRKIKNLDINKTSPIQAINLLNDFKKKINGD